MQYIYKINNNGPKMEPCGRGRWFCPKNTFRKTKLRKSFLPNFFFRKDKFQNIKCFWKRKFRKNIYPKNFCPKVQNSEYANCPKYHMSEKKNLRKKKVRKCKVSEKMEKFRKKKFQKFPKKDRKFRKILSENDFFPKKKSQNVKRVRNKNSE